MKLRTIDGAFESDSEEELEVEGDYESASKIKINVLPRFQSLGQMWT